MQDNVYDAVLKQLYHMYRLFWGTFASTLEKSGLDVLKTQLENFFNAVGCWQVSFVLINEVGHFQYLKTLKIESADIVNIFRGIQYLPLDRQNFLKIQCFVNTLESKWAYILHSTFLYNEHVIW